MTPVGGGIEEDVVGPAFDAAFKNGFQGLVAGIRLIEAEVVAEENAAPAVSAQNFQQRGQGGDVFPVNFHQSDRIMAGLGRVFVDAGVDGLDERALSHPTGAPEKRVVCGKALGETACVFQKGVGLAIDPLKQGKGNAVDLIYATQNRRFGVPDIGLERIEIIGIAPRRGKALQGRRDSVEQLP